MVIKKANANTCQFTHYDELNNFVYVAEGYDLQFNPGFTGWKKLATNGALSMPSGNVIYISLTTSDATYTAPADGWVYTTFICKANGWFHGGLYNAEIGLWNFLKGPGIQEFDVYVPVKKGDTIKISLAGDTSVNTQRFIYAQSEV